MADAIVHRGPDDAGYYLADGIGMGMRRLSIIDLETGKQPIRNESGTVWVVLNGEIYNYREKRKQLEQLGHRFYTSADTEVIVHLYEEFGADCVDHLRGMFGFALWDSERRSLLLARDRLGIKPLYYGVFDQRLVFASEVKCFLALPDVERRVDNLSVEHLFTFLVTPPTRSIIQGIHKLEPGHVITVRQGETPRPRRYWDIQFQPDERRDEADFAEELRAVLDETVELHMISDVPLGAFLSGGVDSSAVVATMARASDRPVKTFSIGFTEQEFDESHAARAVAKHLGTEHHELVLEPDVLDVLDDLAWYLDEPFGDSSAIPTYMVSKLAAGEVTVVLSGDGGDEVFGGYDKYVVEGRERARDQLPQAVRIALGLAARAIPEGARGRNFARHFALAGPQRYLDACSLFKRDQRRKLFSPDLSATLGEDPWNHQERLLDDDALDWLSALQYADFHAYLPLDILTKVDRMSMAHSIETRVPLLDHVLVETAARIPSRMKLSDGQTKRVFKRAIADDLPAGILQRRKQGFAVPLGRWFRGRLGGYVQDLLLSPTARARGYFRSAYVEKLIAAHNRGRPLDLHLWTLISFELWCRTFLDGSPARAALPPRMEAVSHDLSPVDA